MNTTKEVQARDRQPHFPSLEKIQQGLSSAKSINDFFGKDGISGALWARLFADTLETMLEAELTEHLGYERYEAKGRNRGNSRNGKRPKKLRTSAGDTQVQLPHDRNSEFSSKLLEKHQTNTNELEEKILAMYGKGMSTRDIQNLLTETYGVEVSADTISAITDKVWPLVEAWQNRPLAAIYPIIYLDALHLKLRKQGRIENVAVYIVLGVDLEGHRDVLGHWLGDGAESANFWLSVITDLQARGVEDIFIACIDGLTGFKEAIHAIFPRPKSNGVSFIKSATACNMWHGGIARRSRWLSKRYIRPAPAKKPRTTSCTWARHGVRSMPLPSSPGRTSGKTWQPSSCTQPRFAA